MEDDLLRKSWYELVSISPRFMGTSGEKNTVQYLTDNITKLGLKPVLQRFDFDGWVVNNEISLKLISPVIQELNPQTFLGSGSSKEITGRVVHLGETIIWNMYNWNRFGILNEDNLIIGYITGRPSGGPLSQTLSEKSELPHFIVGEEESNLLYSLIDNKQRDVLVSGKLETYHTGKQVGKNVIVRFPSSNSKEKIIFCAHYDTMFNTPGAYDNTSGTAVLLSLAKLLKDSSLNKSIEIVFMGAEEWNLAGSTSFVNQLSKEEKDNIELVINIDGLGRGDVFEAWVGPEFVERDIFTFFKEFESLTVDKKIYFKCPPPPGSDHTPFYNEGIPVCMFTINDQEIIHTSKDVTQESIYQNMVYCLGVIEKFLRYKRVF